MKPRPTAIACFAAALLLWPPAAAASAGPLDRSLPPQLRTQVGKPVPPAPLFRSGFAIGSDGRFQVSVRTFGSAVIVLVKKKGKGRDFAESAYLARGVATPNRLQATFGRFGRVSMRFRPATGHEDGHGLACRDGVRLRRQKGVFAGSFRFRGEGGYVSVRAHRAKGSTARVIGTCFHHHAHERRTTSSHHAFQPPAGVIAIRREGVQLTAFAAFSRTRRTSFFALREETRGRLAVERLAVASTHGEVHINEAATKLRVHPPAWFDGAGVYRAAPDGSASWSGGLSVNFPGAPRFPLTGVGFETLLEAPF